MSEYKEAKPQAKRAMREALHQFKKSIPCEKLDEDPKAFPSYVREVQGKKLTVGSINDKSGNLINDAKGNAKALNDFFRSDFTANCTQNTLSKVETPANMPKIIIREDGIVKLLKQVNPNKA